jgi:thiol-disulfide isomerase/thioredoxin
MSVSTVAVGALCVFGVLNLLVSAGIVRRLRELTELVREQVSGTVMATGTTAPMLGAGRTVGPFEANTTDGAAVGRALLSGVTLVGVFSPGCTHCRDRMPSFVELAGARHREQVLAAVAGGQPDATEVTDYVTALTPVAQVVREATDGAVTAALRVDGFPAFALLDANGVVLASGVSPDELT